MMVETGGEPGRDRRGAGLRQVTDTGAIEPLVDAGDRRQPRQGRRVRAEEAEGARLVRRPGDEGDRRQGQPAAVNELLQRKLGL